MVRHVEELRPELQVLTFLNGEIFEDGDGHICYSWADERCPGQVSVPARRLQDINLLDLLSGIWKVPIYSPILKDWIVTSPRSQIRGFVHLTNHAGEPRLRT